MSGNGMHMHMHRTAPHLIALGTKVTDLSTSGWVSNTASGQHLMDRVRFEELPSDVVYVLDLLGNSSVRLDRQMKVARFRLSSMGVSTY